jgi:hypothetical protein
MSGSADDRELIVTVSRDLVAAVAPEEMALFRPISTAYFDAPDKLSRKPGDDMLGFGAGEVVTVLTPVVLSVVADLLVYLRREVAQTAAKDATGAVDEGVRALFHRFRGGEHQATAAVPGLTHEQLVEIRRLAFEKARAMRLSEARAGLLADAMVGSLAVSA